MANGPDEDRRVRVGYRQREDLQGPHGEVGGVVGEGPIQLARRVVADPDAGDRTAAPPAVKAEQFLAGQRIGDLHGAVVPGGGRGIPPVKGRVASVWHPFCIPLRVIVGPELEVTSVQVGARDNAGHARGHVETAHRLLEYGPVETGEGRHADAGDIHRKRIHRDPDVIERAVASLQLKVVADTGEA